MVVPAGRRLAAMVSTLRDWFVMLATTRMTKSFKMVLLRVLLDNDAVFSGMPIPELAATCREFLVAHEFLSGYLVGLCSTLPL